ncbi:MAG: PilZ domain-containing protein [Candidatus Sulfotelmatobacter sp.]
MKENTQPAPGLVSDLIDRRSQPRFKLEVDIKIHSRICGLVQGRTVDISESGISAMLPLELQLGELVELDFTLPFGRVTMYALVRQRSAFRYGFQFLESNFTDGVIRPTCRVLAMEQSVGGGI